MRLARAAVQSFLAQTYPDKELVIINDGDADVLADSLEQYRNDPRFREIRFNTHSSTTLGDLRNLAQDHAVGDWCIQWDDDDWYGARRIEYQMELRRYGQPTLLNHQIRYSFPNDTAYHLEWNGKIPGIPGTICYPRGQYRYRSERRHEDSHFIADNFRNTVVLNNSPERDPGPELYIRFYHGKNTWDHKHIMREFANPARESQWRLAPRQKAELESVLSNYYEVTKTVCH